MSTVNTNTPCPLCGETVGSEEFDNTIVNCRTREQDFVCGNPKCGFANFQKIKHFGGRPFWLETTHYPMNDNGKVLRPPEPPTAAGVKKGKVDDTPRTASMNPSLTRFYPKQPAAVACDNAPAQFQYWHSPISALSHRSGFLPSSAKTKFTSGPEESILGIPRRFQ